VEGTSSFNDCCTARGLTPIQLDDGSIYWQVCYYCANVVKTIISPQAIVDSSDVFQSWQQTGYRCGVLTPGCIRFDSHDGLVTMKMTLVLHDGLHYCPTDVYAADNLPASRFSPAVRRVAGPLPVTGKGRPFTDGSPLLPRQSKLNPRCGFFDSALPVSINLTCCPVRSMVYLWISDPTPSAASTTRNRHQ
jgi:hypothetical protein